jgi:TolB-like protein
MNQKCVKKTAAVISAAVLLCFSAIQLYAAETMAFGYLENTSSDQNYEYLETIFPNSFAGSIKNSLNINVIKPQQIKTVMKKHGLILQKNYSTGELINITDLLGVKYFIYGSFSILPNDRIKIRLKLFNRSSRKMFVFSNNGKMETEIFKLVDRITQVLFFFLGDEAKFINGHIKSRSKIGIITNLEGHELNDCYYAFSNAGHPIAGIQGNEILNPCSYKTSINVFENVESDENSIYETDTVDSFRFVFGSWAGNNYAKRVAAYRELFNKYNTSYLDTNTKALENLSRKYQVDYLLLLGFNGMKNRAWIRCIDIKDRELVWFQSNINGSVQEICRKIADKMKAGLQYESEDN